MTTRQSPSTWAPARATTGSDHDARAIERAARGAPRETTSAAQLDAPAARHYCRSCDYLAVRRRSELRTTNTDEHAIAALASMGESRPAIASGTISTL